MANYESKKDVSSQSSSGVILPEGSADKFRKEQILKSPLSIFSNVQKDILLNILEDGETYTLKEVSVKLSDFMKGSAE